MATFNKFYGFTDAIHEGAHVLATDQLEIALCAAANTPVNTNNVLADLTQIAYTNLTPAPPNVTTTSSTQTTGTYSMVNADLVLTASGGAVAAFQFIVLFNETGAVSGFVDPLLAWWDYGSALTLNDTETLTLDFGANTWTVGP